MSKDIEFYKWNTVNVMANLLQAEDHLCTIVDAIAPEHAACVFKHLTVAIGEVLEMSKHCYIADKSKCKFFRQFSQEIYKVLQNLQDSEINDESLGKVRTLRKRFENEMGQSTDKCETGFCKFKPDEVIIDKVDDKQMTKDLMDEILEENGVVDDNGKERVEEFVVDYVNTTPSIDTLLSKSKNPLGQSVQEAHKAKIDEVTINE